MMGQRHQQLDSAPELEIYPLAARSWRIRSTVLAKRWPARRWSAGWPQGSGRFRGRVLPIDRATSACRRRAEAIDRRNTKVTCDFANNVGKVARISSLPFQL